MYSGHGPYHGLSSRIANTFYAIWDLCAQLWLGNSEEISKVTIVVEKNRSTLQSSMFITLAEVPFGASLVSCVIDSRRR